MRHSSRRGARRAPGPADRCRPRPCIRQPQPLRQPRYPMYPMPDQQATGRRQNTGSPRRWGRRPTRVCESPCRSGAAIEPTVAGACPARGARSSWSRTPRQARRCAPGTTPGDPHARGARRGPPRGIPRSSSQYGRPSGRCPRRRARAAPTRRRSTPGDRTAAPADQIATGITGESRGPGAHGTVPGPRVRAGTPHPGTARRRAGTTRSPRTRLRPTRTAPDRWRILPP